MAIVSWSGKPTPSFVYNEYDLDGGPAAKALGPKSDVFTNCVHARFGIELPEIEIVHLVVATIALKGNGGTLFIFGSSLRAYLLFAMCSVLLFHVLSFFGAASASDDCHSCLYDFYNYDNKDKEFKQLFIKFTHVLVFQILTLNYHQSHSLLFFVGVKNSIPRRQTKKVQKTKTVLAQQLGSNFVVYVNLYLKLMGHILF
ncbi:hypothetical protein D8674_003266 [Pyrus ussuriensis x Pyrus communis]|uniref:Uncharacterized protein n=1 Tax=Pyrus ussuriensis x Pyrus communis TaxID=2448454 RepID=A0A5N5FKQ6_9ROSA|nr:hypothetical protein D8674_003266 [Pyrus ussuriensis x Pyrus communis]